MKNKKCIFDLAWVGQCKNDIDVEDYCKDHITLKCVSCGKQATHECDETFGLVCGAPLCGECEHTIQSNGCNSGGTLPEGLGHHCKINEQKNKPWYVDEK